MSHRQSPPLSKKVWADVAVSGGGQSDSLDTGSCPFVSAFGHANAATTITAVYSDDGATWYAGPTKVLSGAGDFDFDFTNGARFVALQSSGAATITAIISAK